MARHSSLVAFGLVVALAGIQVWQAPLMAQPNLADMFIPEDNDAYDPGVAIGTQFPAIRALHDGAEITAIDQFMGEKGAVFIANRSADW